MPPKDPTVADVGSFFNSSPALKELTEEQRKAVMGDFLKWQRSSVKQQGSSEQPQRSKKQEETNVQQQRRGVKQQGSSQR
jgi:hypothetical protein